MKTMPISIENIGNVKPSIDALSTTNQGHTVMETLCEVMVP